jgi:hypothetical protein
LNCRPGPLFVPLGKNPNTYAMDKKNINKENEQDQRPKGQEERLREEGRREDGTRGNLDLDKDGAAHREREERDDDASSTGQRGTGIPGFGV